jgi:drug/metabolite transporter (DMT)-like permease
MVWLLVVSLVWAFSFGLIKGRLAGVDPALVALVRVALALAVFLPLWRPSALRLRDSIGVIAIGAVQFGLMYVCYIAAFAHLQAYEIALLTIFTPLFVCATEDLLARRWHGRPWVAALIATLGAGIVLSGRPMDSGDWTGVLLVQLSNACFAIGQVAYRRWRSGNPTVKDARVFALAYLGAVIATLPAALPALDSLGSLAGEQWLTLLYLGVVASGLCFFLWNYGALRTAAGSLAVVNNAKIPLAVACSLFVFGEPADLPRLLLGGGLVVTAGVLAGRWPPRLPPPRTC